MPSLKTEEHQRVLDNVDHDFIAGPKGAQLLVARITEITELGKPVGVDTETTGLDPLVNQVRLIQVGTEDYALVVDLDGWRRTGERRVPWELPGLKELKAFLESDRPKVLQNAAFDLNFLRAEGVKLGGGIFDTMIAAKVVNNGTGAKNDLGSITQRELKVQLPKELQKSNWTEELTLEQVKYAARDVVCLPRLVPSLTDKLTGSRTGVESTLFNVFELEMRALRPIALMQAYGFKFDKEGGEKLKTELGEQADRLMQQLLESLDAAIKEEHPDDESVWLPRDPDGSFNTREKDSGSIRLGTKKYKGFNPRSPVQMAQRLEQAGIMLPPDQKGKPSLDQNLLAFLRKEFVLIDEYLTWKNAVTRVSAIEKLLKSIGPDGRIHSSYRQMGTETGRLSCSEPNTQQIPRDRPFRELFLAELGCSLVVADFSQVELRVAAELSGEERMLEAYLAGRDLHTETAALMAGVSFEEVTKSQRQSAKVANFGLLYGAGPATLQKQAVAQYGIDMSMEEAREIVDGFRAAYPRLYEWQQEEGSKTTEAVFTAYRRRRMLTGFNDKYTTRINTQVQGTAGDIAKIAIIKLWEHLRKVPQTRARLIAMVHDEIVLEVEEGYEEEWGATLKRCMEEAGAVICQKVPIVAEVSWGKTWADAK